MVKRNFAAWKINAEDFSDRWSDAEKLHFFARYAILAPSGHNSQPWEVKAQGSSLLVKINTSHYLSGDGSGLLSVEPYISIGTFLENFNMAARGFGYKTTLALFPSSNQVAEIGIEDRIAAKPELLDAIVTRVSNRNFYEMKTLPKELLSTFVVGNFPGVKTTIITERDDIKLIARQTEVAIENIMANPSYRKELSAWVRINQTRKYDGMPGFTHGFGGFKSLVSKAAVRHIPKHGPQARKSRELIEKSGALIIVRCSDEKKESFVNAGRIYSQICVFANRSQLATSALGASVLDSKTREMVKQHLKIRDRPLYIIRLGKTTTKAKHSPRWPLEKILIS